MRILNAVTTVALALTACYSPNAEKSCDFACTADNMTCPGGMTCIHEFCQVGPTDQCSGVGNDAPLRDSGSGGSDCPAPPAGCSIVSTSGKPCLTLCGSPHTADLSFKDAITSCGVGGVWQLAILADSSTYGAAASELVGSDITWIGLGRGSESLGTSDWSWLDESTPPVKANDSRWAAPPHDGSDALGKAAGIEGGMLYSDPGGAARPYACSLAGSGVKPAI